MRCSTFTAGLAFISVSLAGWAQQEPSNKRIQVYPPPQEHRINPGAEYLLPNETRRIDGFVQRVEQGVERIQQRLNNIGQAAEGAGEAIGNARDRLRNQIFGEPAQPPTPAAGNTGQPGQSDEVTMPRGFTQRHPLSDGDPLTRIEAAEARERAAQNPPAEITPSATTKRVMLEAARRDWAGQYDNYQQAKAACDARPEDTNCPTAFELDRKLDRVRAARGEYESLKNYLGPEAIDGAESDPLFNRLRVGTDQAMQRLLNSEQASGTDALSNLLQSQDARERAALEAAAQQRRAAEAQRLAATRAAALEAQRQAARRAQQQAELEAQGAQQSAGAAAAAGMMMNLMRNATPPARTAAPARQPAPPSGVGQSARPAPPTYVQPRQTHTNPCPHIRAGSGIAC